MRPLEGKVIVVTRPREQAADLIERLESLGAEVIALATIRIEPLDPAPLRAALAGMATYRWIVFTSQNAVPIVCRELAHLGGGIQLPAVVAVGPRTAEALRAEGVDVALQPERYDAEGIVASLGATGQVRGRRVLYPAAQGARDVIPQGLRELGADVDVVPIYRSTPTSEGASAVRDRLLRGEVDLVTFASGSAVQGFVSAVGAEAAKRAPAASIGPATSEAVRAAGMSLCVEAEEHTAGGLVEAIVAKCR